MSELPSQHSPPSPRPSVMSCTWGAGLLFCEADDRRAQSGLARHADPKIVECEYFQGQSRSPYSLNDTAIAASSHRPNESAMSCSSVLYVKTKGSKEQRKKSCDAISLASE